MGMGLIISESTTERKLAENQLFFRQPNKKVSKGFKELKEIAVEQEQKDLLDDADPLINFYCECSDENCRKRIRMTPSKYEALHKNTSQFTILPGHDVPSIEHIVKSTKNYIVVEKYNAPKGRVDRPRRTNLHND